MNKPTPPRRLAELLQRTLNDAFARQGFASTELVTRWQEIVGPEIGAHCEPEAVRWPRPVGEEPPEPGTLVLRVEGPTAVEIQHLSRIIIERVNRFFGWRAVAELRLRQAPLSHRETTPPPSPPDTATAARIAASLTQIDGADLRQALARLGAAVKRG